MSGLQDQRSFSTRQQTPALLVMKDAVVGYTDSDIALNVSSFQVAAGERVGVIGPSGAGKTTLLKSIAYDTFRSRGASYIDEALRRDAAIGFVSQHNCLTPWKTVEQNISWTLRRSGKGDTVGSLLEMVGLDGHRAQYPDQLSGGMLRRLMLARSLATKPRLLLLDEAFAGLDYETRRDLVNGLDTWLTENHVAIIHISHDFEEIVCLSDTIYEVRERQQSIDAVPYNKSEARMRFGTEEAALSASALRQALFA
jgi:NitT/TauT family transport system ATP-binding protein